MLNKKILITIIILLLSSPAWATQILISHSGSTQAASLTRYMPVMGVSAALYTTDAAASTIMPTAGTIDLLNVKLSGTAGSNRTFTLYKNGSPTALTCGVGAGASTCTDVTHSVSYSAGDTISMEVVTVASASTRANGFSMRFTPTTAKESVLMYVSNAGNYTTGNYATLTGSITINATETNVAMIMPETATVTKMYCSVDTAPGVGTSVTFSSRNNSGNGNLSCAISGTNTSNSDTSNTDTISTAGDPYATLITVSGAASAAPFKVSYVYTTPTCGNFPLLATGAGTALSTSATRYFPANGLQTPKSADALLDTQQPSEAFTIKSLVVRLSAQPGVGKSYAFNLLVGGSGSALTNTLSDTTQVQTASTDVSISAGNLLSTSATPSGTPASALYKGSYIGNYSSDSCSATRRRML